MRVPGCWRTVLGLCVISIQAVSPEACHVDVHTPYAVAGTLAAEGSHPIHQVEAFAAETRVLAEKLKAQGPGAPGIALSVGLDLLRTFQQVSEDAAAQSYSFCTQKRK